MGSFFSCVSLSPLCHTFISCTYFPCALFTININNDFNPRENIHEAGGAGDMNLGILGQSTCTLLRAWHAMQYMDGWVDGTGRCIYRNTYIIIVI